MASVNKVILIGNLGRDPEVRYLARAATRSPISTSRPPRSGRTRAARSRSRPSGIGSPSSGVRRKSAANICARAARSMSKARLQTRKWTDKDGNERYTTEIRGDRMQMLGGAFWRTAARMRQPTREPEPLPQRRRPEKPPRPVRNRRASTTWTTTSRSRTRYARASRGLSLWRIHGVGALTLSDLAVATCRR